MTQVEPSRGVLPIAERLRDPLPSGLRCLLLLEGEKCENKREKFGVRHLELRGRRRDRVVGRHRSEISSYVGIKSLLLFTPSSLPTWLKDFFLLQSGALQRWLGIQKGPDLITPCSSFSQSHVVGMGM